MSLQKGTGWVRVSQGYVRHGSFVTVGGGLQSLEALVTRGTILVKLPRELTSLALNVREGTAASLM